MRPRVALVLCVASLAVVSTSARAAQAALEIWPSFRGVDASGVADVLGNAGIFDSYNYRTGAEVYRSRLLHKGSGFSASPVISDGRLYASSEDGDIFVVRTGPSFELLAQNAMGEPLMATPAIAGGTMFVRGPRTLFAIGKK